MTAAGKTKTRPALKPYALATRLVYATGGDCSERLLVPMTALAASVSMLGAGDDLFAAVINDFSVNPRLGTVLRHFWAETEAASPFLKGRLDPLIDWLDRGNDRDIAAIQRCFDVLAQIDVHETASQAPVLGDLLGPVYSALRSPGSVRALGAHFTPMSLSRTIASIATPPEGANFLEPSCGAGGMAVAAAWAMQMNGLDPRTVTWVLNDIDPVAVALAGINAVVHGLGPNVVLTCGDGLLIGAGTDG